MSSIEDADFAAEAADLAKNQILASNSYASPSLSHIAEDPVALEISLLLGTWLAQRAFTLGDLRPIFQNQLLPAIPSLYPEIAIVIECKRQFLESRIRVKYVKGRLKDAHVILAMANGQIKGAGNALDSYKYLKVQVGSFGEWD